MGNKNDEKFRNFLMFNIYATDDELNKMAPVLGGIAIIVVLILLICWFFK
jgi:hypothetical protein